MSTRERLLQRALSNDTQVPKWMVAAYAGVTPVRSFSLSERNSRRCCGDVSLRLNEKKRILNARAKNKVFKKKLSFFFFLVFSTAMSTHNGRHQRVRNLRYRIAEHCHSKNSGTNR